MFTLQKPKDRDFRVLNLTDTHLTADEWECKASDKGRNRRILEYTIGALIARTSPDLITVLGRYFVRRFSPRRHCIRKLLGASRII